MAHSCSCYNVPLVFLWTEKNSFAPHFMQSLESAIFVRAFAEHIKAGHCPKGDCLSMMPTSLREEVELKIKSTQ